MSKKNVENIRKYIIKELKNYDIMPFIMDEISYSLSHLNQYKLTNIKENMDIFVERIINLNQNYCNSL